MSASKLKILQVASFEGNVGDNANHNGTRRKLAEVFENYALEFTDLEIREFFWKQRYYDDSFAELVNSHDLTLFGGGNFFELWVDHSCNGTSVDIPVDLLKKIDKPMVFYALGMDPGMGASEQNVTKFKRWLDYVLSKPGQFKIALRNDGALQTAYEYLGESYAKHMQTIPDGGFFTSVKSGPFPEVPEGKKLIGVNIAGDMLDVRFPQELPEHISETQFLDEFAELVNTLLDEDENLHFVFFCHIYKDYYMLSQLFKRLKDWHLRRRVTTTPYLHGPGAEERIFGVYKHCNLVMGNRFHTNVCAMGLHVPTIGFVNYPQIEKLYTEVQMTERTVRVNTSDFRAKLESRIRYTLAHQDQLKRENEALTQELEQQLKAFLSTLKGDFLAL